MPLTFEPCLQRLACAITVVLLCLRKWWRLKYNYCLLQNWRAVPTHLSPPFLADREPDKHRKLTPGVKGHVRQDSKLVFSSNSWGQGGSGTHQGETVRSTWAKIQCGTLSLPFCFHVECLSLFFIKYMYCTNDIVATLTRILNKGEEIFLVPKPQQTISCSCLVLVVTDNRCNFRLWFFSLGIILHIAAFKMCPFLTYWVLLPWVPLHSMLLCSCCGRHCMKKGLLWLAVSEAAV